MGAPKCASFRALLSRVQAETLSVSFILGMPRGGTTAIEKHLHRHLPYDANVNEPSLHLDLGTPASSPEERAEMTFSIVLAAVERSEKAARESGRILSEDPIRLLVKEVTNKVLPAMVPRWVDIAAVVLVIFRNPSLQLESRLKSIVDRVKSGALKDWGITDDIRAEDLRVHGKEVVLAGACGNDDDCSFRRVFKDMVKDRDFSKLGPGLERLSALHPFCADPEAQNVMWGDRAPQPPLSLKDFGELSGELCSELLGWRLGWEPLRRQLPELEAHPHVLLLDFSSFQIAPKHMTAAVDNVLRQICKGWTKAAEQQLEPGQKSEVKQSDDGFALHGKGWDEAKWQAWYGVPCYGKVSQRDDVEPVLKAPAPASQFPLGCQQALSSALEVYKGLASDSRSVRPPAQSMLPFSGIDPLYDDLWDPCATDASRSGAVRRFLSCTATGVANSEQKESAVRALVRSATVLGMQLFTLTHTAFVYSAANLGGRFLGPPESKADRDAAPSNLPNPCLITVVVPCYNEEAYVATSLHSICCADAAFRTQSSIQVEVVVVMDGATSDATPAVVKRIADSADFPFPLRIAISSGKGRGAAMAAGVREARGHALLFLHADCILPTSWDTLVVDALRRADTHAACFRFHLGRDRLTGPAPAGLGLVEMAVHLRSNVLQLPFGDQGLAITRAQLEAAGGFPDLPILEDYALMVRLMREKGRTGRRVQVIDRWISCAPRRFEQKGVFWTWLVNNMAMLAYLSGVPATRIFRLYYGRDP